ncbi:MAG: cell division protein FtsL [Methylicorpusculum sp.]|uniref:cell division protein FtsL n=1 Tax=Methylicorpusculum sp. TaxID=2713644 RepID=UPI0027249982|nr:cell division protein FtsL [Methylicorpusculum sp.]MDO8845526.1 cell division protein FtsL [Methylicorpusculum sp.]MDO8938690.1 cell division protein FtsL [Methylicorpusculum sp.]MDO9242155.1 cell division protein FtsL [Methylicorpusculum sp.]MDP2179283.1 cell division protein FtsL [Methylicorpusculum sp.]MDP2200477.1 cell division protein FtsL [Methylicorpusculum sp.]
MNVVKIKVLLMMGLVVGLLGSALAVIYSKYQSRLLFIDIQKQERELDRYEVEWGQLQLELTTLAEENRVEQIAREKLRLVLPQREAIIYIKP